MLKSADTAPKDGSQFWAYWIDKEPSRRLVKWNDKAVAALIDTENNIVVEPALAVGWITQDSNDNPGVANIDGFAFWAPEGSLNYRNPFPSSNPLVPSLDQEVLARLAYKIQEAGYAGIYIFECLIPEGDNAVNMEAVLDKIVGYMTGASQLPKLDPSKPYERF